jgi:hypothetical protein
VVLGGQACLLYRKLEGCLSVWMLLVWLTLLYVRLCQHHDCPTRMSASTITSAPSVSSTSLLIDMIIFMSRETYHWVDDDWLLERMATAGLLI